MNPQLRPLIELQALDRRIAEIKEHQRQLPVLLDTAQSRLNQIEKHIADLTAALEAATKERRSLERDLEVQEAHLAKLRDFSQLKSNQEYQARLFEIEIANKRKGEMEEKVLLCMEKIEQHQRSLAEAWERKTEAEKQFAEEKARLDAEQAALNAELAELEDKHKQIAVTIEKSLLVRYTKLRASRKEQALAPVRNGICYGCKLQLPPQLVAEVRRSDVLLTCNHCQRILYWEGEPAPEAAAANVAERHQQDEEGESV